MNVNDKYIVVHLCIGVKLSSIIELSNGIIAENAGYYGNNFQNFASSYVGEFFTGKVETIAEELPDILPHERDPVISLKTEVNAKNHKSAISKANEKLEAARIALGTGYGAAIKLFGKIVFKGEDVFYSVDLPEEPGFLWTSPDGDETPSVDAANEVNNALSNDIRLAHLLDLYHQALGAEHVALKISLLFLCLEAISAGLNRCLGGNKSKNAILMDRHYTSENLPLFQISNEAPIVVNHIDLAYEVRNSFFHGGSVHDRNAKPELIDAFLLYEKCPEMFILAMALDCWRGLVEWAGKTSKAYLSWNNKDVSLEKTKAIKGGYRMHYIGCGKPRRGAAGVMIRCGEKPGQVLFPFLVRFRSHPIAFRIAVPGGKDPNAKITHPEGYKLCLE